MATTRPLWWRADVPTRDPHAREKRPPMRRPRAAAIVPRTTSRGQVERERRRRDRAILQLWRDGWTGKKIAAHLDITPAIIGNVTHKHGATRHARTSPSNGCTDAPAAAWESYRVYF